MNAATPETDAERLGAEIREVRKARGLTLNDLSRVVSCSVAYLSRIERGAAKISPDLMAQVSAALGTRFFAGALLALHLE